MSAAEALFLTPTNKGNLDPFPGAGYHGHCPVAQTVANWHDQHHAGAFVVCTEQPCEAVRRVDSFDCGHEL